MLSNHKGPFKYYVIKISTFYSGGRKLVSSLVERKDVSSILTIFPKNFWNKWYLIWKPLYRAFRICKKLGVASSWGWPRPLNCKSTTFTKTCLEPLINFFHPQRMGKRALWYESMHFFHMIPVSLHCQKYLSSRCAYHQKSRSGS